jgi:hypothetical protein
MEKRNKLTFSEWWEKNQPIITRIASFLVFLPKFRRILLQLISILNAALQQQDFASMQVGEKVNDDIA